MRSRSTLRLVFTPRYSRRGRDSSTARGWEFVQRIFTRTEDRGAPTTLIPGFRRLAATRRDDQSYQIPSTAEPTVYSPLRRGGGKFL